MKRLSVKIRLPPFIYALVLLQFIIVSCDEEWPDDICTCHKNGNVIDGWGETGDSTIVNKKDSVPGFEISVDGWGKSETHDIQL